MSSGRLPPVSWLLHEAVLGTPVAPGDGLCFVCGREAATTPYRFPDQFMDLNRCGRAGDGWCQGCEHAFTPPGYRRFGSALLTRTALVSLSRADLDRVLFVQPWPAEPYAVAISLAKKKNVIPFAPVNGPRESPVVQFETERVAVERAALAVVRACFRALYEHHSKANILADEYPFLALYARRGGDIAAWQAHRAVVRPWLGSAELALIAFITGKEDLDGADTADS